MPDERKSSDSPPAPAPRRALSPQERAFVEGWKAAGPELKRIRAQELGAITDETRLDIIERIFSSDFPIPEHRMKTSGLVEQQRRFARIRESLRERPSS
jgi:hypothetical protein